MEDKIARTFTIKNKTDERLNQLKENFHMSRSALIDLAIQNMEISVSVGETNEA